MKICLGCDRHIIGKNIQWTCEFNITYLAGSDGWLWKLRQEKVATSWLPPVSFMALVMCADVMLLNILNVDLQLTIWAGGHEKLC